MECVFSTSSISLMDSYTYNCYTDADKSQEKKRTNRSISPHFDHVQNLPKFDGLWRSKVHIDFYLKYILLWGGFFFIANISVADKYIDEL